MNVYLQTWRMSIKEALTIFENGMVSVRVNSEIEILPFPCCAPAVYQVPCYGDGNHRRQILFHAWAPIALSSLDSASMRLPSVDVVLSYGDSIVSFSSLETWYVSLR